MLSFDSNNLNHEAWAQRARAEAALIYNKPSTRNNRSLQEIYETTKYGHAAEQFLIEQCGYTDDPRPYKDVFNTKGQPTEVKVTEGDYYVPFVLKRANEAAANPKRNYPKNLIIFTAPRNNTIYKLYGYYEYNGKQFAKSDLQIIETVV